MDITIKINGQPVSVEVSIEVSDYLDQAKHKSENLSHEKRRHWDYREFNDSIILNEGRNHYFQTPEQVCCRKETLKEIMEVLTLCTETQRKRFLLYALDDLSLSEIGKLEGCSKYAVRDSIEAVRKKYWEIFNIGPHE